MCRAKLTLLLVFACFGAAAALAQSNSGSVPIEKAIVYIECKSPDGQKISRGSGVLVSDTGAILTAEHVAPMGFTCLGGIGTAATLPNRKLIRDARKVPVDAVLLRFVRTPNEKFPFVRYRKITDSMREQKVLAHGFRGGGLGDIFTTEGIISQTNVDGRGIVGTDALQSSGMSGGPVVLKEDRNLIGIIVGADFDPNTGAPSSFGVLAAQEVAVIFELTAASTSLPRTTSEPTGLVDPYIPQHEELLRETLSAVAQGFCPSSMSAVLHAICKQHMPDFGRVLKQKGAILNAEFAGLQATAAGNAETYSVLFSQGQMVWLINTAPDGKILTFWSPSQ